MLKFRHFPAIASRFLSIGLAIHLNPLAVGATQPPQLTFSVESCDELTFFPDSTVCEIQPGEKKQKQSHDQVRDIGIVVEENNLIFTHALYYNCCASIILNSEIENNVITVVEANDADAGSLCRCSCDRTINASIGPLESGMYRLQVYGVKSNYSTEPDLLFDTNVLVP